MSDVPFEVIDLASAPLNRGLCLVSVIVCLPRILCNHMDSLPLCLMIVPYHAKCCPQNLNIQRASTAPQARVYWNHVVRVRCMAKYAGLAGLSYAEDHASTQCTYGQAR